MRLNQPTAAQPDNPGLGLAVTLGLIALAFSPLMNGGYSSGGAFQVGYVLLPLAAALAWVTMPRRPLWVQPLLIVYCLAALPLMPWLLQGGREIWYYVLQIPAAWIITWACLRHVPDRKPYLWPVLTGAAVLTALYGWYLWIGAWSMNYQIYSTFGLHNSYAGYLLLCWPIALIAAQEAVKPLRRWIYAAAGLLLVVTLVLTYSRAAWAALALQLLAVGGYILWRRFGSSSGAVRLAGAFTTVAVLCTAALLTLPAGRDTLSRLFDFTGYSFQGRLRFWEAALEMFRDWPLGTGLGNFAFTFPQYQQDYLYYSIDPHSWPLQLLSELGIFGLVILSGVIVGTALWVRKLWRATGGSLTAVLLCTAVLASLLHAAVDFDYYFGAVTTLMGVLLAYGAHLSSPPEPAEASEQTSITPAKLKQRALSRLGATVTLLLLLTAAGFGEVLTLERYQLDNLRDNPGLAEARRLILLEGALSYNRFNHRTHYRLASIFGAPGELRDLDRAREELELCLQLNPSYSQGWALKGLLSEDPAEGDRCLEEALRLDPYNSPDHYFFYANLAQSDAAKRERLLLGLERIPAHHPITPAHPRPTWHDLNPMWAEWYYELARLTADPEDQDRYRRTGAKFQAYWEGVLREREAAVQ